MTYNEKQSNHSLERIIWNKELVTPLTSSSRSRKQKSEDFITNLLGIKDPNITILDVVDAGSRKEVIAKLDYPAPKCQHCQGQMAKYDFQKSSKIPYLECAGYKTLIRLRKRHFRCQECGKRAVSETSLVKRNTRFLLS